MKKAVFILMLIGSTMLLADGAALFKRCAICHGEKGEKHSLNVSKVIAGWKADRVVEKLKAYKAKTLDQYGFSAMMNGQATRLTEEEMREVAEYVQTLPVPPAPQKP